VQSNNNTPFSLNFFVDDFYFSKESNETFKNYRNSLLKLILDTLKKYQKRLYNIDEKLKECEDMNKYRIWGELITANLYKIPNKNLDKVEVENYYDNNNSLTINLDKKYLPSINAKRFFKKYSKLKNALEVVSAQKADTLKELDYIESVIYELESANNVDELATIFEEISENDVFKEKTSKYNTTKKSKIKKSKLTKNKNVSFNPVKYNIDGYTVFVGRNNKENDYLNLKFANKNDLWFHTKDIHGSHTILKLDTSMPYPDEKILAEVAKLAALHSKAKNSSNVPVDFCEVKYVKKPSGAKPGMVIYTNYKTINVNP
jgi:predicted ribosome quality control (RQC) complex YloA/Tae2 family protein